MYVRVDPQRINNIWRIPFEFYLKFRYTIRHFVLLNCLVYIYLPRIGTMQILIVFACWVVCLWENIGVYESNSFPAAGYNAILPKGWTWVPLLWKILHLLHFANNLQQALLNYHLIKVVFVEQNTFISTICVLACGKNNHPHSDIFKTFLHVLMRIHFEVRENPVFTFNISLVAKWKVSQSTTSACEYTHRLHDSCNKWRECQFEWSI